MNTKKRQPLFRRPLVLGAILLPFATTALACGGDRGHKGGWFSSDRADKMIERMSDKLELTDEQRKELDNIKSYVEANRPKRKDRAESGTMKAVEDLVRAENFDRVAFETQWQEMAMARSENMDARKEFMDGLEVEVADFLASLTQEQRVELANRMEKFGKGRHRGKGGKKYRDGDDS